MRRTMYLPGRPDVPPLPQQVILTDRADGTKWLLTYTLTPGGLDGNGYISITDQLPGPQQLDVVVYPAYGELYVADPPVRLFLRGGRLGVELDTLPAQETDRDQALIVARLGRSRKIRAIKARVGWTPVNNELAWEPRDL